LRKEPYSLKECDAIKGERIGKEYAGKNTFFGKEYERKKNNRGGKPACRGKH